MDPSFVLLRILCFIGCGGCVGILGTYMLAEVRVDRMAEECEKKYTKKQRQELERAERVKIFATLLSPREWITAITDPLAPIFSISIGVRAFFDDVANEMRQRQVVNQPQQSVKIEKVESAVNSLSEGELFKKQTLEKEWLMIEEKYLLHRVPHMPLESGDLENLSRAAILKLGRAYGVEVVKNHCLHAGACLVLQG